MSQHILVVDDEDQIRHLLSVYLMKKGYRVSTAANSKDTQAVLAQEPVDLVVLDIGLADEDGLKLLEKIKLDHPEVLVVMLTGMGFVEELLIEAQQKGADGYVSKVLPLEELYRTIKETLATKESPAAV